MCTYCLATALPASVTPLHTPTTEHENRVCTVHEPIHQWPETHLVSLTVEEVKLHLGPVSHQNILQPPLYVVPHLPLPSLLSLSPILSPPLGKCTGYCTFANELHFFVEIECVCEL